MLHNKSISYYLKKLSKQELINIICFYHELCDLNNEKKSITIIKEKKDILIDYINDYYYKYIEFLISLLDKNDFNNIKKIIKNNSIIGIDNEFLLYLNNKNLLFNNEMAKETFVYLKKIIKRKTIKKIINENTNYYCLAQGIIIAYGVIDLNHFKTFINDDVYYKKIELYYNKDYYIDNNKVYSNKLSNKKKIKNYYKDKNLRVFKQKDFIKLGKKKYHHTIKNYKKLILLLKRKYIFKNYDIMFLDNFIIIPYLYSSLNEEKKMNDELIKVIDNYFEFNNSKLKNIIINNIIKIKNEFPLWELRGKSYNEVK